MGLTREQQHELLHMRRVVADGRKLMHTSGRRKGSRVHLDGVNQRQRRKRARQAGDW